VDFFDKVKDGLSKGIDTIGAKGKELMEDTQAQLQLAGLRDKRKDALTELGALTYALFQKGGAVDAGARPVCETIAALDQQIAAKQAELKREGTPAAAKCECGAENAAGAKFCPACGKKIA
jgi:hypothetical protein